jgi:hypothetical protein
MRKLLIAAVTVCAVMAIAGVAIAANQYGLPVASTAPKGKGSPTKPFPTGVKFGYTVSDEAGPRGAPVEGYKIAFQGLTDFAKKFPKCAFSDTSADEPLASVEAKCKKAKVGSGRVESLVALDANQSDPSAASVFAYCNLQLTLYNVGDGMSIRLDADNTTLPTSQDGPFGCIVPTHRAIHAKFRKVKIGGVRSGSLDFTVPSELRHNSGFTITVARTESTIRKWVRRVKVAGKKRKVGYYSSIGCGKKNKRLVRVTFVDENGVKSTATKKVKC